MLTVNEDRKHVLGEKPTVDEVLNVIGFGRFQWRMLILTGLCWMADAAEMTVLGFLMTEIEHDEQINASPTQASALGSAVFVGMWLGLTGFGMLADVKGRRTSYLVSMVIVLVFGLASSFSPSYAVLVFFRMIVGIGVGGAGVAITLFSEFLPAEQRGAWSIYIEAFWTVGTLMGAGIAWGTLTGLNWRWMVGLASLPPIIAIALYPFMPESPRQLLVMGHRDKATALLYSAAKENGVDLPMGIELAASSQENDERGQIKDLFLPAIRRTTIILFILSFVNCFAYYGLVIVTPAFFSTGTGSGSGNSDGFLEVFIISAAEFPGIFIAAYMINRAGRKWTQSILLLFTGAFSLLLITPADTWVHTIFAIGARMCILGAYATLLVVYIEAFPTKVRGTGVGVCGSFARIAGIITPFVANVEIEGAVSTFIVPLTVYAGFAIAAGIFVQLLPETTGQGLDDVDNLSEDKLSYQRLDRGDSPDE